MPYFDDHQTGTSSLALRVVAATLLALLCLLPSVGCATTPTPPPSSWSSTENRALSERIADFHVHLQPSTHWTAADLEALLEALEELPRVLLPTAERPLRLVRINKPCLNGIGRYTEACPSFADDGSFFVYDIAFIPKDGPSRRLLMIDEEERFRLLRKRALAHALMARADQQHRWSQSKRWRQINGWDRGGKRPHNRHPEGFMSPLGQRTAHLDLVTSAESFLFRVEDVALAQAPLPANFDADMSFTCQEFTRSRIIHGFFDALDPHWQSGTSRDPARSQPHCAAFERWADLENISGVDVLFAAERTDRPESLFGHLLLHVRHRSTEIYRSEGFEYVYQFGALTDTDVDPITYLVDGFTGRFLAIFDLSTFRGIDHTYLQLEQRTLRRYALHLTQSQTRQLMERIWEVERRFAYPYYFTTRNCASMVLDLLDPVLDLERPLTRRMLAMPTEVLDILASVTTSDGTPLLEKRPYDVLSAEERAILAIEHLRRLAQEVDRSSDLGQILFSLRRISPQERSEHYERLATLLLDEIHNEATFTPQEVLLLMESLVDVERATLARSRAEVLAIEQRSLLEPLNLTSSEVFAFRQKLFSHENLELRAEQRNALSQKYYLRFRDGERRPLTRRETRALKRHQELEATFESVTALQETVIDHLLAQEGFDPYQYLQARGDARQASQTSLNERSLSPSNTGRLRVGIQGPSPLPGTSQNLAPQLTLHLAVLDDHLGQRRLHGHRPEVEAVGIAMRLRIPLQPNPIDDFDTELTALRYISLATPRGSERRSLLRSTGWGMELAFRFRNHEIPVSGHAFFGLFLPLYMSSTGVDHIALGLGPALTTEMTPSVHSFSGGAQAYLLARKHLGGPFANVYFLRARHLEAFSTVSGELHRASQLQTGLEFFLPIGPHGLLLSPYLEAELLQYPELFAVDDRRLWFGFSMEPLRHVRF